MTVIVIGACVLSVWALLSLIGSDRVARQRVVDDAAAVKAAAEKRRVAAQAEADAETR